MKALSMTQPWASLVAIGEKRVETRSWNTNYRGKIAIHAAKNFPREARRLCFSNAEIFYTLLSIGYITFNRVFQAYEIDEKKLITGAVIATCKIIDTVKTGESIRQDWLTRHELAFGNFTPGRYAWLLEGAVILKNPIPAKGALGLWDWDKKGLQDGCNG